MRGNMEGVTRRGEACMRLHGILRWSSNRGKTDRHKTE